MEQYDLTDLRVTNAFQILEKDSLLTSLNVAHLQLSKEKVPL